MAYKMKGSPLRQSIIGNMLATNPQQSTVNSSIVGNLANQQTASTNTVSNFYDPVISGVPTNTNAAATPTQGVVDNNRALINSASNAVANTTSADATKTRVPAAASIIAPKPATIKPARRQTLNPSTMTETPINPKAFSNANAIRGVNGRANSGAFTRTVQSNEGPMMQLANPDSLQDGPELPPQGVQTSVTPTLGFENS
jgi:hypothetical protein